MSIQIRVGFCQLLSRLGLLAVAFLTFQAESLAQDLAVTTDGLRLKGTLVSVSPDGIDLEQENGQSRKVSIVDLEELFFDGEPESLAGARRLLHRRDATGAAEELLKIEEEEVRQLDPRVREEYEFVRVAANAVAAEPGAIAAWEKQLADFLQKNARSHRFYYGSEILGDVRARQGNFTGADEAYRNLDRGPPALRVRSASTRAGLLMRQGKFPEAITEFTAAEKIETDPSDAASSQQKLEATLGRARCLGLSGKAADGISVAQQVIRDAEPQDKELLALAFNALGTCQRGLAGKNQDSLISFLTVDLVYNSVPEARAEALYNLIELWNAANQPERAREATQFLITTYPHTPWAAKVAGAGKAS